MVIELCDNLLESPIPDLLLHVLCELLILEDQ
jgi:hypothetical protein